MEHTTPLGRPSNARRKIAALARQFWPLCRHIGAGMNPAWTPLGKAWHCVWPMLPAMTLATALVLVACVFTSCGEQTTDLAGPGPKAEPRTPEGVPIIRVLITPPQNSLVVETRGGYRLLADKRVLSESASAMPAATITRTGNTWHVNNLHPQASSITIETRTGGQVRVGDTLYCGGLVIRPSGGNDLMVGVNHVDLESYLAGVLPKELYAYWAPQTYRAVAVAARTFARYQMWTAGAGHDWDVGDNQGSQMYGGFTAATPKSWSAVRDTHGVVLAYGQPGREKVFYAQYSACNGGVVNGAGVLRELSESEKIPPLEGGQLDPDGKKCAHYRWDPVRVTKAELHKAMLGSSYPAAAKLANVREVRVASETNYGRAVWLDVVDSAGYSVRLRADDLRLVLLRGGPKACKNLYSMNCHIRDLGDSIEFYDGKGFGHGVGLSQWGAEDKAQAGWVAEKILQFYYPGAVLVRAY